MQIQALIDVAAVIYNANSSTNWCCRRNM